MSNAITKVYLLNVPLESDYKNTLYFADASAQQTYFQSKVVSTYSYSDFTYQRKDHIIRVPAIYDNVRMCNYVMYQNTAYSNKWFYAFIDKVEYINDNRTDIHITTDVIQTWMFDYTVKSSFVEREHVSDDTVGLHTISENLATGDYICQSATDIYSGGASTYICISSTELPSEIGTTLNTEYNGVYSGATIVIFRTALAATNFLRAMDGLGKGDAIVAIFLAPQGLCGTPNWTVYNVDVGGGHYITFEASAVGNTSTATLLATSSNITVNTTFDSYTPRNNKLYCYPYNYFYVSNNVGSDTVFHYEDFVNNTASFKVVGALTVGCSIKAYPLNYQKLSDTGTSSNSYNSGIVGSKYPTCSWKTDSYINWLTQNSVNIAGVTINPIQSGYIGSAASIIAGAGLMFTGAGSLAGAGLMAGGAMGIWSTMQEDRQRDMIPQQAKGSVSSGDVTYSAGKTTFPVYKMCIRKEYASIIDGYFDMFGYKVNSLKVPNKNHRARWWYTKTIDVNIDGAIPNEDMQKIKNCYNSGITFWRNASEIQDYSLSNGIL